jgi:localization factor PodJL
MSGAQGRNVKGIDPKVREAAREAAERQGMSLGEYLDHLLANQQAAAMAPPAPRSRPPRPSQAFAHDEGGEEDWRVGSQASARTADPARLLQRLESIERRTQLAVTGLDRAVSTIDRSVLGLAARIEDAEALSSESVERVAEALEHFRAAGDESRQTLEAAAADFDGVREQLESQVAVAQEVARRAEAAASFLTTELEQRDSAQARGFAEARGVAEEAARQATQASADAVAELRLLQEELSARLTETETSTRRAVETAVRELRDQTSQETRGAREELLEEVVRLEKEIGQRIGAIDQLKAEQTTLISRIERAEAGARESTAGLRQAAGAAIADLRNAQLSLAARVKQVENGGGASGDLTDLRHHQQDIAERLTSLERKTEANPVADALAAFEARLAGVESADTTATLDQALQRLGERLAETESTANTAIRTLEETVSTLGARQSSVVQETEAVRDMLEQRLTQMVGDARSELAEQLKTALEGGEGAEGALTDVNRRLAAAERRQAQTIEAISLEIRRMSETVDKRLRAVEARNDDAAAAAVREELAHMSATLEQRFDEIERREGAAYDRLGLEVGRLSERLEERVGAVENRSAQAIEQVGEQVARMADRFNQRQETLARDLGERMLDSEERASARVSEAIGSIMQRLAEVEANSADAIAPVQKAMSSVASKLDRFESGRDFGDEPDASTPFARQGGDEPADYTDPYVTYVSPRDAARPLRAGPLTPPAPAADPGSAEAEEDLDLYFSEHDEAPVRGAETPPPPLDFGGNLDDDLLVEDVDVAREHAEPPARGADFWNPAPDPPPDPFAPDYVEPEQTLGHAIAAGPPVTEPAPPPGRNDYLANARKAAQAQAQAKTRPEQETSPRLSLRGSSRVVLWGATTAIVALAVGGAWYFSNRGEPAPAQAKAASVDAPAPTPPEALTAPPPELLEDTALPLNEGEEQPPLVAGPLAPRNVSLEQAAQAGDLLAQYELGLQRLTAGRHQDGVALLRRAADRGFAMAQYRLAKLYERGEGVPVDLSVARQWTERAAAAGNRRAMHDLGVYFARGEGAPLDEAAAFRWFRQAAELGVADSQYNLGVLYQQGRGVNASAPEALFWFLVAARQGDQDASARATALEAQLPQAQAQQARGRAQAFRPRAASAVANGEFEQRGT